MFNLVGLLWGISMLKRKYWINMQISIEICGIFERFGRKRINWRV
jgi:hypothetical protein